MSYFPSPPPLTCASGAMVYAGTVKPNCLNRSAISYSSICDLSLRAKATRGTPSGLDRMLNFPVSTNFSSTYLALAEQLDIT